MVFIIPFLSQTHKTSKELDKHIAILELLIVISYLSACYSIV